MTSITERQVVSEHRGWRTYGRHRYAVLFYSLLLMLVVSPVAAAMGMSQAIVRLLVGLALVAAVMPNQTRHNRYILLGTMLLVVVLRMGSERDDVPVNPASMSGLIGVIGLICAAGALRAVVTAHQVNTEVIYAALSTYLLAGIFFAQLHLAVEGYMPGSYEGPDPFSDTSAIYFSFVTLATLGYGDFLPKTDLARGLTTFEVIGGQLYLAVMVARLIGMFPGAKSKS